MSRPAARKIGERLMAWICPERWTAAHWILVVVWLVALLAVQWKLGLGFAGSPNPDLTRNDQGAYLRLAVSHVPYWWPTVTDGIRNPLIPFLLKPWASPELPSFFEQAKVVNVLLGLFATVAFGIYWLRRFPFLAALNLTTLTALVVTLPSSSWVGAEALFYVGFFFLWLLLAELLVANPLWKYALAGGLAGLTYLAKPSITLLVGMFFALSVLRAAWSLWRRQALPDWTVRRLILGASVFAATMLLPILPRANYAAKEFGNPFQNTAQACMWFDDWPTAYARLSELNPRNIGKLPPEERPTVSNFLKRNSGKQIWERFSKGMDRQWHNFLLPEGTIDKGRKLQTPELRLPVRVRGAYLGIFAGLALALAICCRGGVVEGQGQRLAMLSLAGTVFAIHFAAFSFYTPIAGGARFIMAMYLPVLAALAWTVESLRRGTKGGGMAWPGWSYVACQGLIGLLMLWHLGWLSTVRRFGEMRGAF